MNRRSRPALYVLVVVLALTISLVAWHASVSVAQESEPTASSTLTTEVPLVVPVVPVPGGPGFYSQTALAFKPYPGQSVPYAFSGRSLFNPDSSPHAYEAMVSLPHGATITKFVVWYVDNHANLDMWAVIGRAALDDSSVQQIANVASSGAAGGVRYLQDTSIATPTVDQQSYTYWVEVYLPPTSSVMITSFRIDFQYGTYLPLVTKH